MKRRLKLVKGKPVPPKFNANFSKFNNMVKRMTPTDCFEGCTLAEARCLGRALRRAGFGYTMRKQNGTGISVWKLAPETAS